MSVWNWKVSNKEGQKVNYQKELDKLILELKKKKKKCHGFFFTAVVHHAAVMFLEYLSQYF